ncbi:hypothetical protein ACQVP2_23170 [Methylobacterium aquaticum]|jgi:hypothetical protein|uniref:hypothetical protein n=1 Tax=Methylobacterium aquaticum TaxID=270351 RepID=UPI000AD35C4A|nr:hypothetical protein [Methylobacterium aquaticum]
MKQDYDPLDNNLAEEYFIRTLNLIIEKKYRIPTLISIDIMTDPGAFSIDYSISDISRRLLLDGLIESKIIDGREVYNLTDLGRKYIDKPISQSLKKYPPFHRMK